MNVIESRGEGVRPRVKKIFTKPSLTKQEFKAECDLGLIVKKFGRTPEGAEALKNVQSCYGGQFIDVSEIPDYRSALDAYNRGNEAFMRLLAVVRRRFNNDAAEFLDFCNNPANLAELRSLGLAKPEAVK